MAGEVRTEPDRAARPVQASTVAPGHKVCEGVDARVNREEWIAWADARGRVEMDDCGRSLAAIREREAEAGVRQREVRVQVER